MLTVPVHHPFTSFGLAHLIANGCIRPRQFIAKLGGGGVQFRLTKSSDVEPAFSPIPTICFSPLAKINFKS